MSIDVSWIKLPAYLWGFEAIYSKMLYIEESKKLKRRLNYIEEAIAILRQTHKNEFIKDLV